MLKKQSWAKEDDNDDGHGVPSDRITQKKYAAAMKNYYFICCKEREKSVRTSNRQHQRTQARSTKKKKLVIGGDGGGKCSSLLQTSKIEINYADTIHFFLSLFSFKCMYMYLRCRCRTPYLFSPHPIHAAPYSNSSLCLR